MNDCFYVDQRNMERVCFDLNAECGLLLAVWSMQVVLIEVVEQTTASASINQFLKVYFSIR